MKVPLIETSRLLLRAHRVEDFAPCAAMWADPRVTRFIGGQPSTSQQSWQRILTYHGLWSVLGFGYWAIEEKATRQYVGELGFADFRREMEPSIAGLPEMGWALTPSVHGKGYAQEGIRAALEWGVKNLAANKTVCIVSPGNAPSLHLAGKFGFAQVCQTKLRGETLLLMERALR